ncbi:transporter substrate-binding domain-containing protein [Massilia sp. CCM 8695]|uniref:Transporter substrate-binding domain-containing protein n=2 Tax=Massilia frigida TaxID=2609281 RepID=A0ABX0NDC3_9BURK|nr:transporter substrate-binding domain-containing protein [Massilia frigida]
MRPGVHFLAAWVGGLAMLLCCGAAAAGSASPVPADPTRVIRLSSLEWPPYTGASLPRHGATTAVIAAALASMGYRLEVAYFPWSRATALVRHDSPFAGYYPEYLSADLAREFLVSDPIGTGPLGFAYHAAAPVRWDSMADLSKYRIGVVEGYVNTEQFDTRVRQGKQMVDPAVNDKQNLRKLAAGRVPLVLIDRRVYAHLVLNDADLRPLAPLLRFHPRLLEDKKLYICFRPNAEGERVRTIVNAGLKRIDIEAVLAAALGAGGAN